MFTKLENKVKVVVKFATVKILTMPKNLLQQYTNFSFTLVAEQEEWKIHKYSVANGCSFIILCTRVRRCERN